MATDPRRIAEVLDSISRGAIAVGAVVPSPWGIATAIAGAAVGIAADVVRGGQVPVTRAQDPDALLAAMHARWAAQKAARPS